MHSPFLQHVPLQQVSPSKSQQEPSAQTLPLQQLPLWQIEPCGQMTPLQQI
jgi:hypothetical protein